MENTETKELIKIPVVQKQSGDSSLETVDATANQNTPAISILKAALAKVEEISANADKTLQMLQQNLQQVSSQRIGLQHQQNMLIELIEKIGAAEKQRK